MHGFATLLNHPEWTLPLTATALTRGYPLSRQMTRCERRLVAVVIAKPTNTLTIHSKDKSREEMARDFRCIVKRYERARGRPLIYVATVARAESGNGYHAHALLWQYVHAPCLAGWCKDLGLGWPKLERLAWEILGDPNDWAQVAYVLTQHDEAFGYTQRDRHEPIPKYARRLLYPQKRTLAKHCPDLLSALEMAKDPAVSTKRSVPACLSLVVHIREPTAKWLRVDESSPHLLGAVQPDRKTGACQSNRHRTRQ
jgi:hypothetical protein